MKYTKPSYEHIELQAQDVITASVTDNGKSEYEYGGNTYEGNKGTFAGFFDEIF